MNHSKYKKEKRNVNNIYAEIIIHVQTNETNTTVIRSRSL